MKSTSYHFCVCAFAPLISQLHQDKYTENFEHCEDEDPVRVPGADGGAEEGAPGQLSPAQATSYYYQEFIDVINSQNM